MFFFYNICSTFSKFYITDSFSLHFPHCSLPKIDSNLTEFSRKCINRICVEDSVSILHSKKKVSCTRVLFSKYSDKFPVLRRRGTLLDEKCGSMYKFSEKSILGTFCFIPNFYSIWNLSMGIHRFLVFRSFLIELLNRCVI